MRNLRCSVVMDDPLRFARAPLRRRALSPAGVGALPCTGKRSSLYRGLTSPAGEKSRGKPPPRGKSDSPLGVRTSGATSAPLPMLVGREAKRGGGGKQAC